MVTQTAEIANGAPALSAERQVTWPKRTKTRLANGLEIRGESESRNIIGNGRSQS